MVPKVMKLNKVEPLVLINAKVYCLIDNRYGRDFNLYGTNQYKNILTL